VIGIDTNVLVRYLTQDEPRQSAAAVLLIERRLRSDRPGFVSTVVLAELCWVLRSLYAVNTDELADTLEALLAVPSFRFEGREAALRALGRIRAQGGEYPDALIHEVASEAGCALTYTFDRRAARSSGMSLLAS
jgi:predicted nucleic-acid-binding protein